MHTFNMLFVYDLCIVAEHFFSGKFLQESWSEIFLSERTFHKDVHKIIVNLEELSGKVMFPWNSCLGSL